MPKVGYKFSEESKKKMSIAAYKRFQKQKHYYWTNGKEDTLQPECPGEGWYLGRTNNGWIGEQGKKRKELHSQRMQGNKYALSKWKKWMVE